MAKHDQQFNFNLTKDQEQKLRKTSHQMQITPSALLRLLIVHMDQLPMIKAALKNS